MHMVGHAANFEQRPALATYDPADVRIKVFANTGGYERNTVLRAEDEMIKQIGVRARHWTPCLPSPLAGLPVVVKALLSAGRSPPLQARAPPGHKWPAR